MKLALEEGSWILANWIECRLRELVGVWELDLIVFPIALRSFSDLFTLCSESSLALSGLKSMAQRMMLSSGKRRREGCRLP
jgi:hypothetical protein